MFALKCYIAIRMQVPIWRLVSVIYMREKKIVSFINVAGLSIYLFGHELFDIINELSIREKGMYFLIKGVSPSNFSVRFLLIEDASETTRNEPVKK